MSWQDGYKPFLPKEPIYGRIGFYPVSESEWGTLPLPLKCSTWSADVEAVIFSCWLDNYKISAKVEVHPENVFKALYTLSGEGVQLYEICAIRLKRDGKTFDTFAKWYQDTTTGAFRVTGINGKPYGTQGGYSQHMPSNVVFNGETFGLIFSEKKDGEICHSKL